MASSLGSSLTELDTSTGAVVRTVQKDAGHLDDPSSLAVDGSDLWVANEGNDTVTGIPLQG